MKAILTQFIQPTSTEDLKCKAFDVDGNEVIIVVMGFGWDHSLNNETNQQILAEQLISKMDWDVKICGGGRIHNGMAFIVEPK